jgi:proteasome assembly chaperone (PAC2) family protein
MIDFSKMTPELYKKIQDQRNDINLFKKKVALIKLDDDYCEEDNKQFEEIIKKVNEMSEELKKYEI